MKTLHLGIFLVCLVCSGIQAQKALAFQVLEAQTGLSLAVLQEKYADGMHSEEERGVFPLSEHQAYNQAYQDLMQSLGDYLKQKGLVWPQTTRCFNRIYFNAEGKIDYFLYQFKADCISPELEAQFKQLLSEFIQNYRFPLKAPRAFAQCSPVVYQP